MKGGEKMIIYDSDVTNPDVLSEIIWKFSNQIKDIEKRVDHLENEVDRANDEIKFINTRIDLIEESIDLIIENLRLVQVRFDQLARFGELKTAIIEEKMKKEGE